MNMVYAVNGSEVTSSVQEDFGQKDYEREMAMRESVKQKAKADYDKAIADGQVLPPYVEPTFPEYITKLEQWKLGKETITQTAVEHDGAIVRDNSELMVIDGVVEYQTADYFAQLKEERELQEYNALVVENIREKYTQDDEFALIADGIEDATNVAYVAYRAYVGECKAKAHDEVYGS